ncbi:hypothetical protein N7499_004036 [Penicillium canescens]|uniref:Amino acid transporter transmembrane domain-containing protein n=1 Tax=Penicillium canescens TaxID=5083 RepID=A0AAD6NDP3_PENCN|nr:uncharacterized protein N7446_007549 [Penicillium canescens]KAJ5991622.1 hypothetical protein N7522_011829 [Penicillium canescens]KAJ6049125.1 hypothetical protein N7444_005841 [Penicillium canescens]KAJ6052903.1 hypothetical protein N7460_003437 [Penicillium canescens]KAJ6063429.1 hypothetical protein N7446_007549 [Penicillium canescens]KAJ6089189.1 hypothetical protein N7499_004036 [Penicillium canescens]
MEIHTKQTRLHSQHGSSELCEKESQTMIQPSNSISNENTSLDSPQAELERSKKIDGHKKFSRLGWKRLVIILIVEAVALGSLSLPKSFMTLGMVGGVVCSVGIGLIATYASYEVGAVKVKYPEVEHYGDIGRLILGEKGFWIITVVFIFQLILSVGSHCLTGIIALADITRSDVCNVVFGMASALIILLLAIPPTFADIAILGYIDVVSILTAIGITIIATGVQSSQENNSSSRANWSAWPPEGTDFATAMVAINNIVFAYSFAPAIPSFVNEMHTPEDYTKALYALGIIEIVLYTLIGSLVYSFVGMDVQSPALLSAGPLLSRIAFGVALPVIFISGSINTNIVARYIHTHVYRDSIHRYVNTRMGWVTWCLLVIVLTLLSWVVAEAIPVFSLLLSISTSLFNSGLSFYIPAIMWFVLVKEGSWFSRQNIQRSIYNGIVFLFGIIILVAGLYGTIVDLIRESKDTSFGRPFTCSVIT